MTSTWPFCAFLSARIGVAGLPSDHVTALRTVVGLAVLAVIIVATGQWQNPAGAAWQVPGDVSRLAPSAKLSVVLVAVFAAVFPGGRLSAVTRAGGRPVAPKP